MNWCSEYKLFVFHSEGGLTLVKSMDSKETVVLRWWKR